MRDQLGLLVEGKELRLRFANVLVRTSVAKTSPFGTKSDLKAAWFEFVQSLEGRKPAPASCGAPFILTVTLTVTLTVPLTLTLTLTLT